MVGKTETVETKWKKKEVKYSVIWASPRSWEKYKKKKQKLS